MAFTISLYELVGGYDESYFLYWEDVDFSVRASHVGAHLQVLTDVTAIHDEGGTQETTKGRAKSLLYYRYNTRNRLLFAVSPSLHRLAGDLDVANATSEAT